MSTVNDFLTRFTEKGSESIVENAIFYYDSLNGNIRPEFKNLLDLISIELKLQYPNILSWCLLRSHSIRNRTP